MVFKKKEEISYEKIETLVGQGTHFQGVITAQGTVRVDGNFTGEIKTQGDLVIGDNGILEANVEARNILISGQLKGNITAKGKAEITPTGKVVGDIKVKNLIIDEGAIFKGSCLMETSKEIKIENNEKKEEAAK